MEIGSHCFFTGCNRLDFLPIKCPLCKNFFCKDHSLPSVHDCPFQNLNEEATLKLEEKIPIEKEICFIGGCLIAGVKGILKILKIGLDFERQKIKISGLNVEFF